MVSVARQFHRISEASATVFVQWPFRREPGRPGSSDMPSWPWGLRWSQQDHGGVRWGVRLDRFAPTDCLHHWSGRSAAGAVGVSGWTGSSRRIACTSGQGAVRRVWRVRSVGQVRGAAKRFSGIGPAAVEARLSWLAPRCSLFAGKGIDEALFLKNLLATHIVQHGSNEHLKNES